ncbi:RNA polymerase sigma factor [Herbidospora sp. RD11066]
MTAQGDYSDEELVELTKTIENRREAYERIFARYAKDVLRVCTAGLDLARAEDAAQESFMVMMRKVGTAGGPDKLWPWLYGVASRKVLEARRTPSVLVTPVELPEQWSPPDDDRTDEKVWRAEVLRLLGIVVAGLTGPQQEVYDLAVRRELTGQALGDALGITATRASRLSYDVKQVVKDGFTALVLAHHTQYLWRAGRGAEACQDLLGVMRMWNRDNGVWTARTFPAELRHRVAGHMHACPACLGEKDRLVKPYLPGLIPVLLVPALADRMAEEFTKVSGEEDLGSTEPRGRARGRRRDVMAPLRPPSAARPRVSKRLSGTRVGNTLVAALVLALLAGVGWVWTQSASPADPPPAAAEVRPADVSSDDPDVTPHGRGARSHSDCGAASRCHARCDC